MIMKISQLQEPYKTLAKFFKREKTDVLSQAFNWGDCTGKTVKSHSKFWNAVNEGKKPLIPRSILNYREKHLYPGKHSSKKPPIVTDMTKTEVEKQKTKAKTTKLERNYKEELRLADEAIANWEEMCETLREDKEYWFDIADQAHKNEEAMLKELDSNLDRTAFHCIKVAETTGSITIDDVAYCLDLVKRVMHHQFAYKPKQEEI